MAVNHLVRADPEENCSREQPDRLQHTVVGHDHKGRFKNLLRDGEKFIQHGVAKDRFRRGCFYRFDPFNGIDLMRSVLALAFLNFSEKGAQHF